MKKYFWISLFNVVICSIVTVHFSLAEEPKIQLKAPELTSQELRDQLAKNFNVHISTDSIEFFDKPMLEYLSSFFKTFNYDGSKINLHATNEDRPGFVWKKGSDIYFTKTAGDKIPNRIKEIVSDYLDSIKENKAACIPNSIVYEFNNELFYHLASEVLTAEQIAKVLKDELKIEAATREAQVADKPYEHYFSAKELVMVIKQFLDLPEELIKDLPLKKLIRMRAGSKIPSGGVAAYNPFLQEIRISDAAFLQSDPLGEGTFIHEIGHAYWRKMTKEEQDKFISISWNMDKNNHKLSADPYSAEWISSYSASDFQEDFAEHFSAFVHQSEKLKDVAPQKYQFFKEVVFKDTEYFSDAHKKAKIYVASDNPDTEPPYLTVDIKKAVKIKLNQIEGTGKAEIVSEICGVHDDISGIDNIYLRLFNENNNGSDSDIDIAILPSRCIDKKNGDYKDSDTINCNDFKAGIYEVREIQIGDKAGNKRICNLKGIEEIPSIFIPGTKQRLKSRLPHPLSSRDGFEKILIREHYDQNGAQLIDVEFPFAHEHALSGITIELRYQYLNNAGNKFQFPYIINTKYDKSLFVSKIGDSHVRINNLVVPAEYPGGILRLENITLFYDSNSEYEGGQFGFPSPKDVPNLTFRHNSNRKELGEIDVDLNRLALSSSKGEDGNIDVIASFSVDSNAHYDVRARLRTPSGKEVVGTDLHDQTDSLTGETVKRMKFSLPINHEDGEYILTNIELNEDPPHISEGGYPRSLFFRNKSIKLLERGIRKTIKIDQQPDIDSNKKK